MVEMQPIITTEGRIYLLSHGQKRDSIVVAVSNTFPTMFWQQALYNSRYINLLYGEGKAMGFKAFQKNLLTGKYDVVYDEEEEKKWEEFYSYPHDEKTDEHCPACHSPMELQVTFRRYCDYTLEEYRCPWCGYYYSYEGGEDEDCESDEYGEDMERPTVSELAKYYERELL